jgi:hypothetical protein
MDLNHLETDPNEAYAYATVVHQSWVNLSYCCLIT